jgi:hypothetical protein
MNLRILKKLSKRAAPLLPLLGDTREQYPAKKEDSFVSVSIYDWKHWERMRAKFPFERDMKRRPKDGHDWIVMRSPSFAWPGTAMVGSMCGYEEPEWEEETAWESLRSMIYWEFVEWNDVADATGDAEWPTPVCKRDLSTPTLVFAAAREVLAKRFPKAAP